MEGPLDGIDDKIRTLVDINNKQIAWFIKTEGEEGIWANCPKTDCVEAGIEDKKEVHTVIKHCVRNPYKEVSIPFQPEYPDGRLWNRNAPQFAYPPREGKHPHWDMVLKQCFDDLTETLKKLDWAIEANIKTGAQYGLAWLAACFQYPYEKLPYLFFFGDQAGGKSTFHKGLQELVTMGVVQGDAALVKEQVCNSEMEKAVIAIIDEENLSANTRVYDEIKKLVTNKTVRIRKLYHNSYEIPSTLHFIQTANSLDHCPVFPGDTRITVIEVCGIDKSEMIQGIGEKLKREASSFIYTLLHTELPKPIDRFRVPMVETPNKRKAISVHQDDLEFFLSECS